DVEPHDIVVEQCLERSARVGQDLPEIERGKGCMKEEADPASPAPPAQLLSEQEQMIVVDPDGVAVAQEREEGGREARLDLAVADFLAKPDPRLLLEAMEQRPQGLITEAEVVVLELGLHQRQADEI